MSDNRSHIEEKYTWDLSTIFKTDQAFELELAQLNQDTDVAQKYVGHLLDSSKTLLEITESQLELSRRIEKVYVYAHMKNDQDTTVAKYQEYQAKASALYAKFAQVFSFYEPEFMMITAKQLEEFMAEEKQLGLYNHYFEKLLKNKEHILSQREEELLAGAQEIFNGAEETFSILDNADLIFPIITDDEGNEVEITHGNFISLMESKNRTVRQAAYEAMYSTYEQFQHTYAKTLQTNVKVQNYKARVHKYDSARQAAMSANFIPEAVYDTLLTSVNKHLPLLHRYLKLRQEVLDVDQLRMYDIYTPLSETNLDMTYDQAIEKAQTVLEVFGKEYSERVNRAFTERWIDVHVNKGKRSGAYSGGSYDTNAFMLLNWQNNLDNLYTLVHETGHSLHSTLTRENQPYVYGDYSIFLAEIASTTNENILTEALLKEVTDDKARFAILNNYLDGFRGSVFRQTQFAEFEHAIHQADQNGDVLTSEFVNNLYADLNEKYYGLAKEDNHYIQYEWARIPHFYYNYYVYQYSTGFAAASYLANKIVHGSQSDIDAYLSYLKAGNSDYPLEVIAKAGVDMTEADYLDQAFTVFEKRLTELEELVAKGAHK
ncbi:oligoendopeptidase F [Streptococcus hongkongensis]